MYAGLQRCLTAAGNDSALFNTQYGCKRMPISIVEHIEELLPVQKATFWVLWSISPAVSLWLFLGNFIIEMSLLFLFFFVSFSQLCIKVFSKYTLVNYMYILRTKCEFMSVTLEYEYFHFETYAVSTFRNCSSKLFSESFTGHLLEYLYTKTATQFLV